VTDHRVESENPAEERSHKRRAEGSRDKELTHDRLTARFDELMDDYDTIFDKKSGKVLSLAMTGAAPKALKPAEMTPETLNAGMKAGIVPGNLGGYLSLLDRLGTMSIAEVFAPAIEVAEKGYPIDPMLAQSISRDLARHLARLVHKDPIREDERFLILASCGIWGSSGSLKGRRVALDG
jgi:hypothetical protein